MTLTTEIRTQVAAMVTLLDRIPDGQWTEVSNEGLSFQAGTQEEAREIRTLFPGVIWRKEYEMSWWSYRGTYQGVSLHIYAVREAPPACHAIEETYEEMEDVPVTFERRTVTKTRVRWDCGPEGEGEPDAT